jgi:hypothetical protein
MATLHKHIGGYDYYIRHAFSTNGNRYNVTYQIKNSGLVLLEKKGLLGSAEKARAGQGVTIPQSLFRKLQDDELLYTAGSGAHGKQRRSKGNKPATKTICSVPAGFPVLPNGKFVHIWAYCYERTGCAWNEKHRIAELNKGRALKILEPEAKKILSKELDARRAEFHRKQVRRTEYSPGLASNIYPRIRQTLKGRSVTAIEEHEDRIVIFCRQT